LRLVCPANEHRRRGDDHQGADDGRADYCPAGIGVDPFLGPWVRAFVHHRVDPSVGAVGFTSATLGASSTATSGSYGGLRFPAIRKVKVPTAAAYTAIQFARPPAATGAPTNGLTPAPTAPSPNGAMPSHNPAAALGFGSDESFRSGPCGETGRQDFNPPLHLKTTTGGSRGRSSDKYKLLIAGLQTDSAQDLDAALLTTDQRSPSLIVDTVRGGLGRPDLVG
jgi:hypothetical protein